MSTMHYRSHLSPVSLQQTKTAVRMQCHAEPICAQCHCTDHHSIAHACSTKPSTKPCKPHLEPRLLQQLSQHCSCMQCHAMQSQLGPSMTAPTITVLLMYTMRCRAQWSRGPGQRGARRRTWVWAWLTCGCACWLASSATSMASASMASSPARYSSIMLDNPLHKDKACTCMHPEQGGIHTMSGAN